MNCSTRESHAVGSRHRPAPWMDRRSSVMQRVDFVRGWYVVPTLIGGRIILALDALVFGLFGALYWVIPEQMAAKVGVTMTVPAGVVDVQGLYGGLEVG